MKKVSKKRILVLIIITLLVIIEIRAFTNSRAKKLLDINGNFIDTSGLLGVEKAMLQAISQDEAGYYIELPDTVNGKKVKKFLVEEKSINSDEEVEEKQEEELPKDDNKENVVKDELENKEETVNNDDEINKENNTTNENTITNDENIVEEKFEESKTINEETEEKVETEENQEEIIEDEEPEEQLSTEIEKYNIERVPGEKVFLTNEELENKEINIAVEYNTKEQEGKVLYLKHLEKTEENNRIILEGYMPVDGELKVETVKKDNVNELIKDHVSKEAEVKIVYDIKIISEEKEYEPSDFGEDTQVYITNLENVDTETKKYKVVHIKEDNTTEEIKGVETKEDSLQFKTDNFSEYVIVLDEKNFEVTPEMTAVLKAPTPTRALRNFSNEPDVWDGSVATRFAVGSGTAADPYLIDSGAELAYLAERVNAGTSFSGQYFQLTRDINLDNRAWTPIGNETYSFAGVFNGSGRTIKNAAITASGSVTMTSNTLYSFGFFGSLGTGNVYAVVENVIFDNVDVTFTSSGNVANNNNYARGYNIGIVTGSMYNHSKVANVIVKNSSIVSTGNIRVRSRMFQICVGGIAGNAQNTRTGTTDPGSGARYSIENCYVAADINLNTITSYNTSNYYFMAMVQAGGIIGNIRTQEAWPEYCLYTGNITTNGIAGPIFGGRVAATSTSNSTTQNYMPNYWNGNQSSNNGTINLTMTSYYTNTRINNTQYTSTVTSGTSNSHNSNNLMGSVQGNNKGIYTNNISSLLSGFNSRTTDNVNWKYENNDLSLIPHLTVSVTETSTDNFTANVSDSYNGGNYTYKWYNNGSIDGQNQNYECTPNFTADQEIIIIASDGQYYSTLSFTIERLYIEIQFNVNTPGASVTASLAGTALPYVDVNDYTFTWYKEDISGEGEVIEGATGLTLTGLEQYYDYRLVATHNSVSELSTQNSFTFGDRRVIYCNYSSGNDNRDGLTPANAVKTLSSAYSKLDSNGNRNRNVIVIIGSYTDTGYINSQTSTTYNKQVTITGKYGGTNHNGSIRLTSNKFLENATTFMYLTFDGNRSNCFLYCEGHDLTIGEQVVMSNYGTLSSNYGTIDDYGIAFHVMGAIFNPSSSNIPHNNNKIILKSGTYGRIIVGSRSETASNLAVLGTETTPYVGSLTIDIQNSTTNYSQSQYDVNLLVAGKNTGSIYSEVTLNCNAGKIGRIVGGNLGRNTNTTSTNPLNTYYGSTTINLNGSSVKEMYGASLGREQGTDVYYYGTIEININGSTVSSSIYGGGAGGATGYSTTNLDRFKDRGLSYLNYKGLENSSAKISINSGTIQGSIYGGGCGNSSLLSSRSDVMGNFYGTTEVYINGGTITGSVYGAGEGYYNSGYEEVAQLTGSTYVEVTGGSITGNIYGAGKGISGHTNIAKLIGNSTVKIDVGNENQLGASVYGAASIANMQGNTTVNIASGINPDDIYGGGEYGTLDGNTTVNITGGSNTVIYGGGNQASVNNTLVNITGGNTTTLYGGGNQAAANETEVRLTNGTVNSIYGGGNQASVDKTSVYLEGGTNGNTYGGGKQAGAGETHVYCDGTTFTYIVDGVNKASVFGGSNTSGTVTTSNVEFNSGSIPYIYGGNNDGGTTVTSNVVVNGGTITNAFGGGNQAVTTNANVTINNGNITDAFGGGDKATTGTSTVLTKGGTIQNIYGGGNLAAVTTTNVTTNGGNIQSIYGGGNQAGVTTTNVTTNGGTIGTVFGGSNRSGNVTTSNVITNNLSSTSGSEDIKLEVASTVEDSDWRQTTYPDYPTYAKFVITVTNNTDNILEHWNGSIYVEDSMLYSNYSSTQVTLSNDTFTFNEANIYYGTNQVAAGGTYSFEIEILSKQSVEDFTSTCSLTGTDNLGNNYSYTESSNVIENGSINRVYGGNNHGGKTFTANVTINDGSISVNDVFGGGNEAETNVTYVNIYGPVLNDVFGGGNQAGVDTNTNVTMINGQVGNNLYGGGNQGIVTDNTYVKVKDSQISNNLFAGGNGSSAIVYGNTNLIMHGTTNSVTGSVFGGGNRAATGSENSDNSTSTVNIVGGTIGGNVYGGANTSVIYGTANVNIGYDAVNDNSLEKGNIEIVGTVFGGGEANEEGSEIYDFDAISVTQGINIVIDGNGHSVLQMTGSIFGSGNASSSAGDSLITIKNYGTYQAPQSNVSIQRAKEVTIINSALSLSGTTDRTNEYSSVQFSLSRIDRLKLKNSATLYLCAGANLLKELDSLVDVNGVETKGAVTINRETGENSKNVDNRIYMLEGKNLNVATNEKATTYGDVQGMFFFGLFSSKTGPSTSAGLYEYTNYNGDVLQNEGTFILNSYVKARHLENHDITVDGFYTNSKYKEDPEDSEEPYKIKVDYIDTTPPDDLFYIWTCGEALAVTPIEMDLTASKYATLGTYELQLQEFSSPNTKFVLNGFSAGLKNGIALVDPDTIEAIELDGTKVNSHFGLSIRTGNTGWATNGTTTFLAENGASRYVGTNDYDKDNTSFAPTLNFCFYHSQNLTIQQQLGDLNIRLQVLTPIDDLNYDISYILININLSTALFQDDYYEGAITPGQEFGLFTTTDTTITSKSAFSTYFSLFVPSAKQDITIIGNEQDPEAVTTQPSKFRDYSTFKRVIVSRDSLDAPYCFPENTKITMLDMVTNRYYYYVVTSADVSSDKYVYALEDFTAMGSTNGSFDEEDASDIYYNDNMDIIYENFIFHINFADTNIDSNIIENSLLMELRDSDDETLVGVLGIQRDTMKYSVYKNVDATIELEASVSPQTLYLGNVLNINANAIYTQSIVNSKSVYDTQYFDKKLGIKISIFDSNGNRLNSDSLFGVNFVLDGKTYYPRIDGTTRINVADKVTDVLSRIKMHTENNTTLATGNYTIRLESFGSSDGIYYGLTASDMTELSVRIINSSFGLKVTTQDQHKIIDKETGKNKFNNNSVTSTIKYSSGLTEPKITVSLYRRDYSGIYSQDYSIVDIADYVENTLTPTAMENEYLISSSPIASMTHQMEFKEDLVTGTYRIVYKLYDGNNYVGEAYEYVVIK